MKSPKYSESFRRMTSRLVGELGYSVREVATEFKVSEASIRNWIRKFDLPENASVAKQADNVTNTTRDARIVGAERPRNRAVTDADGSTAQSGAVRPVRGVPVRRSTMDALHEQMDAFNSRDLDRFIACYKTDAVVVFQDNTVFAAGHHQMRVRYGTLFHGSPNLQLKLISHSVSGDRAILEEEISGVNLRGFPDLVRGTVVFHVKDGMIQHVRLMSPPPQTLTPLDDADAELLGSDGNGNAADRVSRASTAAISAAFSALQAVMPFGTGVISATNWRFFGDPVTTARIAAMEAGVNALDAAVVKIRHR